MKRKYIPHLNSETSLKVERSGLEKVSFKVNCCRKRHEISLTEGGQVILHEHKDDKAERDVFAALMGIGENSSSSKITRCEQVQAEIFKFFEGYSYASRNREMSTLLRNIPKTLHESLITRAEIRKKKRTWSCRNPDAWLAYSDTPGLSIRGPRVLKTDQSSRQVRWGWWADSLHLELTSQTGTLNCPLDSFQAGTKRVLGLLRPFGSLSPYDPRTSSRDKEWWRFQWLPSYKEHKFFYSVIKNGSGPLQGFPCPGRGSGRVLVLALNEFKDGNGRALVGQGHPIHPTNSKETGTRTWKLYFAKVSAEEVQVKDFAHQRSRFLYGEDMPIFGLKPSVLRTVPGYSVELEYQL